MDNSAQSEFSKRWDELREEFLTHGAIKNKVLVAIAPLRARPEVFIGVSPGVYPCRKFRTEQDYKL